MLPDEEISQERKLHADSRQDYVWKTRKNRKPLEAGCGGGVALKCYASFCIAWSITATISAFSEASTFRAVVNRRLLGIMFCCRPLPIWAVALETLALKAPRRLHLNLHLNLYAASTSSPTERLE